MKAAARRKRKETLERAAAKCILTFFKYHRQRRLEKEHVKRKEEGGTQAGEGNKISKVISKRDTLEASE